MLLDRWRSEGVVQCFNWIEPLMPAPIAKVIWVPAEKLSESEIRERTRKSNGVDSMAISKQRRGNRDRYKKRTSFPISIRLEKHIDPNRPLIVTIDLDYFAGLLGCAEQATSFRADLEFRD